MQREDMEKLIGAGLHFEGSIVAAGHQIREASKVEYGTDLLDARLNLVSAIAQTLEAKNGVPGLTDDDISHRLVLISTCIQGIPATESLISEGQYAKAAAVLKQDYEILARLGEVRRGTAKIGKTPSAKEAPPGSQRFYGDLNKVAHPSNPKLLTGLLQRLEAGEVKGLSPIPAFQAKVARELYELHLFILVHLVQEQIMLQLDMYPGEHETFMPALIMFLAARESLMRAGFIETEAPDITSSGPELGAEEAPSGPETPAER